MVLIYSDSSEPGTGLGMGCTGSGRTGEDACKEGDCVGVGGCSGRTSLDVRLFEHTSWSAEGIGGRGESGGLVLGGVTWRRLGDIDIR